MRSVLTAAADDVASLKELKGAARRFLKLDITLRTRILCEPDYLAGEEAAVKWQFSPA